VKHGKHNDVMVAKEKEDFIRKPPEKSPAYGLVNERMQERISDNARYRCVNGQKKLCSKSLNPRLIPFKGFAQFDFRLWPDDQIARHARLLMRALTSLQGDPSPGFLW
jgi:hypothetical protein